ncbi:MAG: DUF4957 domain-containing protein [Bacteroidales bacterium]|nr:DUF4957 domain-containing protein [Bacteroidales bacterium]
MRLNNIIKWAIGALAIAAAVSCTKEEFKEITSVPLSKCLTPLNLTGTVDVATGVDVTLKWDLSKSCDAYRLVIFNSADTSAVADLTLEPSQVPYKTVLEADGKYGFKVCGVSEVRDSSEWAWYNGTLKTYAIKDNLFLKVTGRTDISIKFAWSNEAADYRDVTVIEMTPVAGGDAIVYTLSDTDKANAAAMVTGLTPSTEYAAVLYFKSASRGAVDVWTNPAQNTFSRITTKADLIAAMTAGNEIFLTTDESPYEVGEIAPARGFRMVGECDADGNRPVVKGNMLIGRVASAELPAVDYGGGDFVFENICFDGTGGRKFIFDHKVGVETIDNIKLVNCEITGYNAGLLYQSVNDKLTLGHVLISGCEIHNTVNSDGEFFDLRKNAAITEFKVVNSTLWDCKRALIRVDDSSTEVGSVVLEGNTFKNFDMGQNKGILYIRAKWTALLANKNLFLWEDRADGQFATTNTAANVPSDVRGADNYYYQAGAKFFSDSKNFTAAQIGATALSADPCVNSKGNVFNLTNNDLIGKKVGAAKWWTAYVEPVEDLTLGLTAAPHNWNFGDAVLFSGDLQKSKVRDGLLMVASEEHPMNLDGSITFNTATALDKNGVPTEGYAAFKVNAAGSVLLKIKDAQSSMVVVGTGSVDGGNITVKGAVTANGSVNKVVLDDITDETLVYLYATGKATVEKLSWSTDTEGVNTALATPKPVINVKSLYQGDSVTISVTWEAVKNAEKYDVVFDGKNPVSTTECSFVLDSISVSLLEAGVYTIEVTAKHAASDLYNTDSAAGTVAFAVLAGAPTPDPSGGETEVEKTLSWDFSAAAWQTAFDAVDQAAATAAGTEKQGPGKDITGDWNIIIDGLRFMAMNSKNRYTTAALQTGGEGNNTTRVLMFAAPAAGTLTIETSTTGNTADDTRHVIVALNNGTPVSKAGGAAANATHNVNEFEISGPGIVYIYGDKALRIYNLSFVYKEKSSVSVNYAWNFADAAWQAAFDAVDQAAATAAGTEKQGPGKDITGDWNITIDGLRFLAMANKNRYTTAALQTGGEGNNTVRVLMFAAPVAGTLTVETSTTGNTADDTRHVVVALDNGTPESKVGGAAANATHNVNEFTISKPGIVYIYGDKALRFYNLSFHN